MWEWKYETTEENPITKIMYDLKKFELNKTAFLIEYQIRFSSFGFCLGTFKF